MTVFKCHKSFQTDLLKKQDNLKTLSSINLNSKKLIFTTTIPPQLYFLALGFTLSIKLILTKNKTYI